MDHTTHGPRALLATISCTCPSLPSRRCVHRTWAPTALVDGVHAHGCLVRHAQLGAITSLPRALPVSAAITATGVIWTRYSTQITPVNYNLLAVNAFMAVTGMYQLSRKYR